MKKNKRIILAMTIAMTMALAGCGKKEESKTTEKGNVEIESSATKADTTENSDDTQATDEANTDSGNVDSDNEDSNNEDSNNEDSNNEDSNNEDSNNEDTNDEDSDNEDSDDDDDELAEYAVEPKEPTVDVGTLRESTVINYNGVTFSIGESEEEVVAKLGEQCAPSSEKPTCLAGTVTQYYYSNMNIQAKNGVIFYVDIMDNGYGGDIVPSIASGITLGTDADTVEACYGVEEDNPHPQLTGYTYVDNYYFVYFYGDYEEDGDGVNIIEIYDSNLISFDN